jgi:hypothetical protein
VTIDWAARGRRTAANPQVPSQSREFSAAFAAWDVAYQAERAKLDVTILPLVEDRLRLEDERPASSPSPGTARSATLASCLAEHEASL